MIASSSSFDASGNGMSGSKIAHVALHNDGACANVANNNDTGVAPRGCTVSLEHAKKHSCKLCTNAQDCVLNENLKEAQPVDLKLASKLRPSTSPADTNT